MKSTLRIFCLIIVVCIFATMCLTGCGSDNKPDSTTTQGTVKPESITAEVKDDEIITLKLTYTGSSGEVEGHKKAIEGIEKIIPNLRIKLEQYANDLVFWDTIPMQIASNTAPDLTSMTNEKYMEAINNGYFAEIDTTKIDLSGISKAAIDAWNVDGKQYGIPYTAAPAAFVINMDMWNDAGLTDLPKTWDDVRNAAKVLTKGDVKGICISDHEYHFTQYALSFGGGWNFGKTINTPENVNALQYCIDMLREGYAVTPKQLGLGWDGEVFASGKAAMTTGGTWYIGFLKESAPDMNYKVVPIPNGPNGTKGSTLHSIAYVRIKGNTVQDENTVAMIEKALEYMVRDEAQERLMNTAGSMPSSIKVSEKYFDANPIMIDIKPQLEYAKSFSYPAESQKFIQALLKGIEEAVYSKDSKTTAQEILDKVQKDFTE